MSKKRFAVVSTDGINVDDHFGKATQFLIYDMDDAATLVEKRPVAPLSVGDPNHPFDPDKFKKVSDNLKDCSQVYVVQIGDTPAAKLKELGVEPVIYSGPISGITL